MNMKRSTAKPLTQAAVAKLPVPTDRPWQAYPAGEVDGLAVRVMKSGVRSYTLRYRVKGSEKLFTIGDARDWTLKRARAEARRLRQSVDEGHDPLAERNADRVAETMRDMIALWREERGPKMRARSLVEFDRLIAQHIDPLFGSRKVADITFPEIDRWHRKIGETTKVRANRTVSLLSQIFNVAIRHKLRSDNPAAAVEKFKEHARQRYLSEDELQRLLPMLDAHPNRACCRVLKLLLATGARFSEVAEMRWDQLLDLDGERPVWVLEHDDTKQDEHHRRPLTQIAVAILKEIRAERDSGNVVRFKPSPFVFPARNPPATSPMSILSGAGLRRRLGSSICASTICATATRHF
jgi:integrase